MPSRITINSNGDAVLTVVENGQEFTVTSENPNFATYCSMARQGESIENILGLQAPIAEELTELSDRVEVNNGHIYFDGEEVHDSLAKTIHRYWQEGRPYGNLVKFMERVSMNRNEHSRNALWDWVKDRNLEVDNQGLLIAYKGVRSDMTSVNSGPALVDDVPKNGHIPNQVGSVISMPRSDVEHDPAVGCATGLHVGTLEYARGFGNVTLVCRVDPVDIVSVPTDCNAQKMRTCRYEVIDIWSNDVDHEPAPVRETPVDVLDEELVSQVDGEARTFVQNMLDKIRNRKK